MERLNSIFARRGGPGEPVEEILEVVETSEPAPPTPPPEPDPVRLRRERRALARQREIEMRLQDVFNLLKSAFWQWYEDKTFLLGAALSFYTAFSVAPVEST